MNKRDTFAIFAIHGVLWGFALGVTLPVIITRQVIKQVHDALLPPK